MTKSKVTIDLFGEKLPCLSELFELTEQVNSSEKSVDAFKQKINSAISKGNNLPAGIGLCIVGNFKEALEILPKAKDCSEKMMYMAWAYRKLANYEQALSCFDKVGSDIDKFVVDFEKIAVYRSQNQFEKAQELLEKHSDKEGKEADFHYAKAMLEEAAGNHQSAVDNLEKCISLNPDHQKAIFKLAFICDLRGDQDMAIDYYHQLLDYKPIYVNALLNLAVIYEEKEKFDDALDCIDAVLAAFPNHPRALLFLKDIESSMNMYYDEEKEKHKDKKNQILETPITDFELSVRSRNCLKKMNIRTLGDLVRISENELLSYKNFGETSLREIRQIMELKGLKLGAGTGSLEGRAPEDTEQEIEDDEQQNDDLLSKSISELELSVRSKKALENLGVLTVGQLVAKTEDELLKCKNFGVTSLNEIKEALTAVDLELYSEGEDDEDEDFDELDEQEVQEETENQE